MSAMGFESSRRVPRTGERGAPRVQARAARCRSTRSARASPGRAALSAAKKEAIPRDEQSSPRTARGVASEDGMPQGRSPS